MENEPALYYHGIEICKLKDLLSIERKDCFIQVRYKELVHGEIKQSLEFRRKEAAIEYMIDVAKRMQQKVLQSTTFPRMCPVLDHA